MIKHTPATPLPWASAGRHVQMSAESSGPMIVIAQVDSWRAMEYTQQDHAYIAHAANAYPKLVEALRSAKRDLWEALGGNDDADCKEVADRRCQRYDALLRELRENA